MNVVDVMTTDVITVKPETGIKDAARLMFRNRVSGLPVVDDSGMLVGIVTEADLLRYGVAREEADGSLDIESVGELMSEGVVTVEPEASLYETAKMMVTQDIKRIPVIAGGKLVGIISRADVVSVLTRPDEVIEDEIREDVLRRILFVDPDQIGVTVSNGVVRFTGEIGTRNEARLLEELVSRLDGVLRVENELSWKVDDRA